MYAGAYKHSAMYQRGGRPVNTGHQEKRSGGKVVEDVEESDLEELLRVAGVQDQTPHCVGTHRPPAHAPNSTDVMPFDPVPSSREPIMIGAAQAVEHAGGTRDDTASCAPSPGKMQAFLPSKASHEQPGAPRGTLTSRPDEIGPEPGSETRRGFAPGLPGGLSDDSEDELAGGLRK